MLGRGGLEQGPVDRYLDVVRHEPGKNLFWLGLVDPESARVLMLQGAEIILTPNACDLEANRLGQFRARAFENMVGVAMTNYAAPRNNGHSVAYDGVVFKTIDGASRDTLIVEAGEQEGVYLAPFDLTELRAYRQRETWGNAYRKPRCYSRLTAPDVVEPFVRADARR